MRATQLACPGCFIGVAAQPIMGIVGEMHPAQFKIVADIRDRILPTQALPCQQGRHEKLPHQPLHRPRRVRRRISFPLSRADRRSWRHISRSRNGRRAGPAPPPVRSLATCRRCDAARPRNRRRRTVRAPLPSRRRSRRPVRSIVESGASSVSNPPGRADGILVEVDRGHRSRAERERSQRMQAGTAADIQEGLSRQAVGQQLLHTLDRESIRFWSIFWSTSSSFPRIRNAFRVRSNSSHHSIAGCRGARRPNPAWSSRCGPMHVNTKDGRVVMQAREPEERPLRLFQCRVWRPTYFTRMVLRSRTQAEPACTPSIGELISEATPGFCFD